MVEIKEINESHVAIAEHANDYTIDSSEEDDGIDDPTLNGWNYRNSFNWIQNQNPIYFIGFVALLIMACLVPPCKISLSISFPAPIWILIVFIGIKFSQDDMTSSEHVRDMVDRFFDKMTSIFGLHD